MSEGPLGEVISLGSAQGVVVQQTTTPSGGVAYFYPSGGAITVYVHQARDPDVPLGAVAVYLIAEQDQGQVTGRYAVMVDDPWWGRRIQPAVFREPPFTETLIMGYRLQGRILEEDVVVEGANVSLETLLHTAEDGDLTRWDSEEYNVLIWSDELETFVSGPEVHAPIRTDQNGWWQTILPKGHGALYQREHDRRDDTEESAEQEPVRWVQQVWACYQGRREPVAEGEPATLNLRSARLRITATPGATVRVGVMDDAGGRYTVPSEGVLEVGNLPRGLVNVAQYMRSYGQWDPRWGGARARVEVEQGETTELTLPALVQYPDDGSLRCGRVYLLPGVPAAEVEIVVVDLENAEILGVAAETDSNGFWSVQVPPQGLGGVLYILDPDWGSMPVLGEPYSDVVLGARAYAAWMETFKPEAWRTGLWGLRNFQWVPGAVWVVDNDTAQVYETEPVPYGGWATREPLPKYRYVSDIVELIGAGPQLCSYRLETDHGTEDPDFSLRHQPFSDYTDEPGYYRATGYYPEKKMLLGGKLKYNVLRHHDEALDEEQAEALRVGLEFGRLEPFVELRTGPEEEGPLFTAVSDLLCPYCGGPAQRNGGQTVPRGWCLHCAETFGSATATQARSYARSVTLPGREELRWRHRAMVIGPRGAWGHPVGCHWRPDLYEETEPFERRDGPGMGTTAPRWWAKHVHELGNGRGLGAFDGDEDPSFLPGEDLAYFGGLLGRELGLAQFKLAFAPGYTTPQAFTLEIDCVREDDEVETVRVTIPAGTHGIQPLDPVGQVIPLSRAAKLRAEGLPAPYEGVGLYRAVEEIRLVEPASAPGCRCVVTNDAPFLAAAQGPIVPALAAEYMALQLIPPGGRAHLWEDPVGQVYLVRVLGGNLHLHRRVGLTRAWEPSRVIVDDGVSDYPWADVDGRGTLLLVRQKGSGETVISRSRDGGESWEES